jgi:hypothetical protein
MRGSKPGERRGGRQKGAKNKSTVLHEMKVKERLGDTLTADIMPLEVMMAAMRKAWHDGDVKEAVLHAERAAPYCHPKLQALKHSGDAENPVAMAIMSGVPDVADTDDDHQRPAAQSH